MWGLRVVVLFSPEVTGADGLAIGVAHLVTHHLSLLVGEVGATHPTPLVVNEHLYPRHLQALHRVVVLADRVQANCKI